MDGGPGSAQCLDHWAARPHDANIELKSTSVDVTGQFEHKRLNTACARGAEDV
jgi:hypothetical protein